MNESDIRLAAISIETVLKLLEMFGIALTPVQTEVLRNAINQKHQANLDAISDHESFAKRILGA